MDDDLVLRSLLLQERVRLAVGDRLGGLAPLLDAAALERPDLRQEDQVRPVLAHRLLDQPSRLSKIGGLVVDRAHLDHAYAHGWPFAVNAGTYRTAAAPGRCSLLLRGIDADHPAN